jgi:Mannosyltransferase putative
MSVRRNKIPRPPGASVEITRMTGKEPELVRHRALLDAVAALEFPYPASRFSGRGIVVCGGGEKYLPSAYVMVRILRHLKCTLPVEVWHIGEAEMPQTMRGLFAELGCVCVDGALVRRTHPVRRLGGWELKCFSLMHSAFAEVMLIDADNCPVRDPAFLFDTPEYARTGAIFWPDYTRFFQGQAVWTASGIEYRDEPEFESGQIVVDKRRCWKALNVAMHLNEYSDWWYRLVHGDKETYHLAWRKIGQDYAMPEREVEPLEATMLQFDFDGRRLFQHRNFAKWKLDGNKHIVGFKLEKECMRFVAELREKWVPGAPRGVRRWNGDKAEPSLRKVAAWLCEDCWNYQRIGLDSRKIVFLPDGTIGDGAAGCERWWNLIETCDSKRSEESQRQFSTKRPQKIPGGGTDEIQKNRTAITESQATVNSQPVFQLQVYGEQGLTFRAHINGDGNWHGRWEVFEKAEVVLVKSQLPAKKKRKLKTPLQSKVDKP